MPNEVRQHWDKRRLGLTCLFRPRVVSLPVSYVRPDAIPFRTYAVAESTGMHDNKGEQPFWAPLRDCAGQTPFHDRGENLDRLGPLGRSSRHIASWAGRV